MLLKGKEALSDAELIAILLGSGSRDESAVDLSKRILNQCQNLNELGRKSLDFFMSFKGVGEAKAITMAAALELGRRRQLSTVQARPRIRSSRAAYEVLGPVLADLPHEEFWIACLNRKNEVVSTHKISSGGIDSTIVDPKIVFSTALRHSATSIVLYHNHPSGAPQPSEKDLRLTKKLSLAGKHLDIGVLDHIIVGNGAYYSFLDEGDLER